MYQYRVLPKYFPLSLPFFNLTFTTKLTHCIKVINHPIPRSLQDEVFKGSEALFKLSMDEKKKLDKSSSVGASNRGYEIIGNQGLQEGTLPDLKEVCLLFLFKLSPLQN